MNNTANGSGNHGNATNQAPNIIINNNMYGGISPKSKIATLILCILLGELGIHRFYVGKVGTGLIWFLTGGLFLIGWILDIIKVASGTFRDGAGMIVSAN